MNAGVECCPCIVSIPQHFKGVIAERRKCREAAEYSDKYDRSDFLSKKLSLLGETGDRTNQETAHEIDCQGAIGEGR